MHNDPLKRTVIGVFYVEKESNFLQITFIAWDSRVPEECECMFLNNGKGPGDLACKR